MLHPVKSRIIYKKSPPEKFGKAFNFSNSNKSKSEIEYQNLI